MKVLIAAGGTGGHVYPALAVAERLRERAHEVVWLGNPDSFESRAIGAAGLPFREVRIRGLRGNGLAGWLLAPLALWRAIRAALRVLAEERPGVVLGMGGFVAGPAGIAAWLRRTPLVIHEQNARAGLTNRALARLARRRLQGFAGALARGETVGNPVRAAVAALPPPDERFAGREGPLRILVLGGSQGARALNERMPEALALLPAEQRPQVRHQGGRSLDLARAAYAKAGVAAELTAFIDDMAAAYAWADAVVCRAGASTVAELSAAGLGGLLVPFPFAVDDHQTANAAALVAVGAARCEQEADLDVQGLADWLAGLQRPALQAAATAARAAARVEATDHIVAVLESEGGKQ